MKICLCLLTFNELEGCEHDVPLINRKVFDQIFAVDGGSKDGTVEYLKSKNIPVYLQKIKGINAAHILAVAKCRADAIVFFHPKATIPVADTLKFRQFFERGFEFVVATRVTKGGRNEEDKHFIKPRKWLVVGLGLLAYLRFGLKGNIIWDTLHGFRGYSVRAFKKMGIKRKGRTIDIESVVNSYRYDIKREEFPTKEIARKYGETHFKTLPFGIEIMKYFLGEFFSL